QNHDYSHHARGAVGVWTGEEMARNVRLTGGVKHLHTIAHAPFRLTENGIEQNRSHKLARFWWETRRNVTLAARHAVIALQTTVGQPPQKPTRPMRPALGWRKAAAGSVRKPGGSFIPIHPAQPAARLARPTASTNPCGTSAWIPRCLSLTSTAPTFPLWST